MGEALLVRKRLGPLAAVNPSTCPHVGVQVSPHSLGESPSPHPGLFHQEHPEFLAPNRKHCLGQRVSAPLDHLA